MTNKEAIIQAIRQFVIEATGLDPEKVVPSSDPGTGPRPALPYVTILVTATQGRQGTPQRIWSEPSPGVFVYKTKTYHQVTVSLQAFGDGANELLAITEHKMWDDTVLGAITIEGVRPTGIAAPTTDITGVIATDWEERARLDLFVAFAQVEADAKGYDGATKIILNAEFTEPATDTVEHIEVTAP